MTKTIMLIHGAWMTPHCWGQFRSYYEARGYKCLAPAWPFIDRPVEALRRDPDPAFAQQTIRPAVVCGQQSLEVFCFGIFLSFGAHFALVEISNTLPMEIFVSVAGISAMTALAYYRSWSKTVDKAPKRPMVAPVS